MKKEKKDNGLCASCGTELIGKFCHKCGEKKVSRKDFALKNFFREVLKKFTHFDSNLLRSFWLLISRPGFLTVEYLRGCRKPYVKPLSLFFIINLLYFITISFNEFRTFETPLHIQFRNLYRPVIAGMLDARYTNAPEEEKQAFEAKFDRQNHILAKSMLLLIVPMLAMILWLIYWRRGVYFGEHLITALHFQALTLVQNMAVGILLGGSIVNILFGSFYGLWFVNEIGEPLLWIFILAFFTLKTVYGGSTLHTVGKAAIMALMWMPIVILYRFIVFLITYYTI